MNKLKHFEGIRGIAALVVFFSHFKPTFCLNIDGLTFQAMNITSINQQAFIKTFTSLFYNGDLPVYIFWFMSAYVISIKLFDLGKNKDNKYLIQATTKRYFRLAIPVFFASFICFLFLKLHWMLNRELAVSLGQGYQNGWLMEWYNFVPSTIHFLRTTIFEVFMTGNSNYNFALWTMSPELLGSFLCFGLFAIFGRAKKRYTLYLALIAFLIIGGLREVQYFFYATFVIGLLWSDLEHSTDETETIKSSLLKFFRSKLTPIALLAISFIVTIYSDIYHEIPSHLYTFFNLLVRAIGFTLLVNNFESIRNIFTKKPFTFLGEISFSLYLIHIPILFSVGASIYLYAGIPSPYKLIVTFVSVIALTFIASYLFTIFIDRKAVSLSNKIGKYFSKED